MLACKLPFPFVLFGSGLILSRLVSFSIKLLVLVVQHGVFGDALRLLGKRMELSIGQNSALFLRVRVVMGQRAVALRHVEAENEERRSADQLLLEGTIPLVSHLVGTYYYFKVVC